MADRKLVVVIAGDDRSLQKTLNRATQSVNKFGTDVSRGTTKFSRGMDPLLADVRKLRTEADKLDERLSNVGGGSTAGNIGRVAASTFAFSQGLEAAGAAAQHFAPDSDFANGLTAASDGIGSLMRLDFAGFFNSAAVGANRLNEGFEKGAAAINTYAEETRALDLAARLAAAGLDEYAAKLEQAAIASQLNVKPQVFGSEFGITFLPDRKGRPTLAPLSPSERREVDLLAQEGTARLPGLRDRLSQLRGADAPRTHEGLLRRRQEIAKTEREIHGILQDQAKARAAAADAAAREADQRARDAEARRREAAERAREARERAAALVQSRQFRAIGLDATGGAVTPTVANLRKQLDQLSKNLVGEDVPAKLTNRLAGVRKVLKGGFGTVTEETRKAIQGLFEAIRQEFDKGTKEGGPLTKTTSINTNRLLNGLGIGPEAERELRARLAGVNSVGRSLAGKQRATGSFRGGPATVVQSNTTVTLDGEVVGRSTKRSSEKDSRRNPKQKVGPWAGR